MNNLYPNVLSPIRVAGQLLKNRIISAPSTMHTAANGEPYPTEEGIRFFEDRAKAGVGLVTCAGVSIGGAFNDGVHASWDINVPNHTNRLVELTERIHLFGAKCTMELIGVFPDGYTVCDGCSIMGGPSGRFIPIEKMMEFKQSYIEAAVKLKEIGFDGIMLHFGHSIPIAQFLSPLTNHRTDQYGGSTENRCRYLKEILQEVREVLGKDMILDIRISGSEFEDGGIDVEEGIRIGEQLQPYCDILQVSAGMHNSDWMTVTHPCSFLPPIPNVHLAEAFKQSGRFSVKIVTLGGFSSLAEADEVIASGKADMVAIARAFIADIDLIQKGIKDRQEDVIPCVKCMRCHDSDNYARHMQCTVNPRVGMEQVLERIVHKPERIKKVAVIGGGPAGMKAALTAAERGHEVTLFEKTDSLGGALKFSDFVSFKYSLKNYKDYLVCQIEKSGIDVILNNEAKVETLKTKGYDVVIAAVGAVPIVPPIPGVDGTRVATAIYGDETSLGERVVVIGGGQVGCETALHLAKLGKIVTILEMQPALAPDASKTHRDELMIELKNADTLSGVTNARCTAITDTDVSYEVNGRKDMIPADSVILAVGMRPLISEADALMGFTEEYAEIGDCVKVRTVEWATKEGYYAAINL